MVINTEQNEFIKHPLCDMKLIGIPGGGKTKTTIDKIVYMKQNKIIKIKSEFLILTFSKKAREDFLKKGTRKDDKLFSKDNIRTIHSLSGLLLFKNFKKNFSDLNTVIAGLYYHLTNNDVNLSSVQCLKKCKYIFVDEAQDISEIQYKTIVKLSELCGANLLLIGDPNQNIYQFQGGSDKFLIEHPGKCIQLVRNYRSTKNIVNFINKFRPWENTEPMIADREEEGKLPKVYCNQVQSLLQSIIKEIKDTNIPYEDIAIIGPVKKGNLNSYGNNLNFGLQMVAEYFEKNNINYITHYSFSENDTNNKRVTIKKEGHINLLTIHGSKGLEFKKVFLLNFHLNTMGRLPTIEKYKEYKYLWYVGLSRAMDELSIFIESGKPAWTELQYVEKSLYEFIGEKPTYLNQLAENEKRPELFSITKLLEDTLFTEEKQYELKEMIDCSIEERVLFHSIEQPVFEFDQYSALYGIFIENIYRYYCESEKGTFYLNSFLKGFINKNKGYLSIPEEYINTFRKLQSKYSYISLSQLNEIKNNLSPKESELYIYLKNEADLQKLDMNQEINIIVDNGVSIIDTQYIKTRCNHLSRRQKPIIKPLFEICLYFYQLEYECGHLLQKDFTQHLESLQPYIDQICEVTRENKGIQTFQKKVEHPNLPIVGIIDALTKNSIIDFKFSKSFNYKHIYQLLLYYNNLFPKWEKDIKLEIWNLYEGKIYSISINDTLKNYMLNEYLCDTFQIKMKNKIFIYDLETTGLDISSDIIERHFIDFDDNRVVSTGLINPHRLLNPVISELTGIQNEDFDNSDDNLDKFKREMKRLHQLCEYPTFIAHNGNRFDHLLLQYRGIFDSSECRLLDSREIISICRHETNLYNKKLSEVYEIVMGFKKENIHRAKEDTDMIVELFKQSKITSKSIHNFNKNVY